MSTNSWVGIKRPKNKVEYIYVHNDGYREYMYPMLSENYNTVAKVEKLLSMGDASSIDKTLLKSIFYRRDLGETDDELEAKICNLKDYKEEEYCWLFDPETLQWERY